MDLHYRLSDLSESTRTLLWTLLWTGLCALAVFHLTFRENDQPIRYKVPSPKRPETVEILDEPAIKVRIPFPPAVFRFPLTAHQRC